MKNGFMIRKEEKVRNKEITFLSDAGMSRVKNVDIIYSEKSKEEQIWECL